MLLSVICVVLEDVTLLRVLILMAFIHKRVMCTVVNLVSY